MDALVLDREAFRRWAEAQPRGRFERIGGEVVPMPPERWEHARLKAELWRALDAARPPGLACTATPDGMTAEIDADTDYQPDAALHVGPPIQPAAVAIPNPVIVAEVLSPATRRLDTSVKRDGYFRVPSIAHYLVLRADRREITHHRRGAAAVTLGGGVLRLDPPGLVLDVDALYNRAGVGQP